MSRKVSFVIFFAAFCFAGPIRPQGFIIPDGGGQVILKAYRAEVEVHENIATYRTTHTFYNPGPGAVQGIFYFPLPADAQVTDFSMRAGGKVLEGELLEAKDARKLYDEIVRKILDPALLEMMENNTFRASVFPIQPNTENEVELQFSGILTEENGLVRFKLPLRGRLKSEGRRILPWRPPPAITVESPAMQPAEALPHTQKVIRISLESAAAINNIYSPSHKIDIERPNDHRARITFESSAGEKAGDFLLYYALDRSKISMRALSYRPVAGEPGYFSLLISPRLKTETATLARKDVILVVDVSGSMSGEKLAQAKQALIYWVNNLNAGDRLALITFSTTIKTLRPVLAGIRPVRTEALDFIKQMEARGGTNIHAALQAALQMATNSDHSLIVFVTDGLPTVGETNPGKILQALNQQNTSRVRIFSFGVGYDVNTKLLDGVARMTSSFSDYISPNENLEERMTAFYDKIRYPVLADLKIDFGGAEVDDLYPLSLPDLFKNQQLILFGKYRRGGAFTVRLTGNAGRKRVIFSERISLSAGSTENEFIAPLWASRKIGYLLDEIQLNGETAELRDEVVRLSKTFGIVTPYTSYLAREKIGGIETLTAIPMQAQSDRFMNPGAAPGPVRKRAALAPQAAPASGMQAVLQSRARNEMKKAVHLEGARDFAGSETRRVANKTFRLTPAGYWQDTSVQADTADLHIRFGGEAYFALLRIQPRLRRFLALGEKIIIAWHDRVVKIDEGGLAKVPEEKLQALFR